MLLKTYLIIYFALLAAAFVSLWQGRILARLPFVRMVAISAACCFLALLSKETGVMLIPAIVALDLYFYRRSSSVIT